MQADQFPSVWITRRDRFLLFATRPTLWAWCVYAGLLVWIVWGAADLRFRLPQEPIVDPDSWGYFGPAMTKLTGGDFPHLLGRNFVYPGFLYLVLRVFDDFQGISVMQHALGLLTGLVLAGAWNVLCRLLVVPGWSRMVARFVGLGLVASFLFSRSAVLFEHTVRPEAVFPLFLALSFLLNFLAIHFLRAANGPRIGWWCLGLNVFVVALAQALKPSLGFGAAAANLPLLFFLCRPGAPWLRKLITVGTATTACALLLFLPEKWLARSDFLATTFLPTTLLTIHANLIHEQIADDLHTGQTSPWNAKWLADFDRQLGEKLAVARQPTQHPWPSLGFNPDYLLYTDSVFRPAFRHAETEELARFCKFYYRRTWEHRPAAMLAKISGQLGLAYKYSVKLGKKRRWRNLVKQLTPREPLPLAGEYQMAWRCCQNPSWQERMFLSDAALGYVHHVGDLQSISTQLSEPSSMGYLNQFLSRFHLPILLLTLASGVGLLVVDWRGYLPLVTSVFLLLFINFAMFLTVAVVHSLEVDRYIENQRVCTAFGEFGLCLLLWQVAAVMSEKLSPLAFVRRSPPTKEGTGQS